MGKLKRNSTTNYDINSNVTEISVFSECIVEFEKECKKQNIYIQKDSIISISGITKEYTIYLCEKENKEHVLYSIKCAYEHYIEELQKNK